jgi:hypothetical protein
MEGGWTYNVILYREGEKDSDIAKVNFAPGGAYKTGI